MRRLRYLIVFVGLLALPLIPPAVPVSHAAALVTPTAATQALASLPLAFTGRGGDASLPYDYKARGPGYTVFLTARAAVFVLPDPASAPADSSGSLPVKPGVLGKPTPPGGPRSGWALSLDWQGANGRALATADQVQPGTINEFAGKDPSRWRTNLTRYGRVTYHDVYPGIDLIYYGKAGHFEYDLVVQPGADPGAASFRVSGVDQQAVDGDGNLVLGLQQRRLSLKAPIAYQQVRGRRQAVTARYQVAADGRVGVVLGAYDHTQPLTIDPGLVAATYLGGDFADEASGIAVDSVGNVYVAGSTESSDFPVTRGAFQTTAGALYEAFVTKLDARDSRLVYSTFLGGNDEEYGEDVAVDAAGDAYVTGWTASTDFPVTPGAFQTTSGGGGDAFVTKLDATGRDLRYSTYLGGSSEDLGLGLAVDGAGNAYIAGATYSTDFPVTPNAVQPTSAGGSGGDAFVAELGT